MSEIIVSGTVRKVDTEEISVSASFTKRELVVTTEEQYPQHISIDFTQGKCNSDLDRLEIGSKVSVSVNLRGREWTNPQGEVKYFNQITGWKVSHNTTPVAAQPAAPAQAAQAEAPAAAQTAANFNEEDEDVVF